MHLCVHHKHTGYCECNITCCKAFFNAHHTNHNDAESVGEGFGNTVDYLVCVDGPREIFDVKVYQIVAETASDAHQDEDNGVFYVQWV